MSFLERGRHNTPKITGVVPVMSEIGCIARFHAREAFVYFSFSI